MRRYILLDSTPLALMLQRRNYPQAEACRRWLAGHLASGVRVVVPEIIDYEVRRELLRLGKHRSVDALDVFEQAEPDRWLPLKTVAMRWAAELWAEVRRQGMPTADRHALDIDVILAAQVLTSGLPLSDLVVATSNVAHLARFVPAQEWERI